MSSDDQIPSGEPVQTPSGQIAGDTTNNQNQIPSGNDAGKKVEYNTYAKTLAQEKALRERLKLAEDKLQEEERKRLELEGKKDELIEHLKKENTEFKTQAEREKAERADMAIKSQIKQKALALGCQDPELVASLMEISSLDVDSNLKVGEDSLAMALDRMRREKPYMFKQGKAALVDAPPSGGGATQPVHKKVEDMSYEEMQAAYRNL